MYVERPFYPAVVSDSQTLSSRILNLLDGAFEALGKGNTPLSEVAAQATRIARLRNDFDNLLWLEMEQRQLSTKEAWEAVFGEFASHFGANELKLRQAEAAQKYIDERVTEIPDGLDGKNDQSTTLVGSIREIEANMETISEMIQVPDPPPNLGAMAAEKAFREKQQIAVFAARSKQASTKVLNRIEQRLRAFLSETEKQVMVGQVNADIFEQNRQFVDEQLAASAPKALEQMSSAYRRAEEGNPEGRSQALLSCRRALKSVADLLCPATSQPVTDGDGVEHALTHDKWINRLIEFVKQKVPDSTSGEVLQTQIDDLARRFRGLGEASSRGVHAEVTEFELNQTVIQTYLTVGDLLRLHADDSGSSVVAQGLMTTASPQ